MTIFTSIQSTLMAAGATLGVIGLIILGIRTIFSSDGGLRKVFERSGIIALGLILIGAATAIVAAIMNVASGIK